MAQSFRFFCFLFAWPFIVFFADSAHAQANSNRAVIDRLDRIERDLMNIQRQSARDVGNTNMSSMGNDDADAAPEMVGAVEGDVQQQITLLQEDLRHLRGMLEKNEFETRQTSEALARLQKDVDFRLTALEKNSASSSQPQSISQEPPVEPQALQEPAPIKKNEQNRKIMVEQVSEPAAPVETEATIDTSIEAVAVDESSAANIAKTSAKETTAGDGTLTRTPNEEAPREHYNRAFRLLNQTRYEEAGSAFEQFTKKFSDDPLIGNAYYWLGETRYIQRDYVKAADSFRQGFEALPNGPKAPDNLLKLAMTLRALNRNDDACTVLGQIKVKFKNSSTSLLEKVEQERTRIGCK